MIRCPSCNKLLTRLGIEVLSSRDFNLEFEENEYRQRGAGDKPEPKGYKLFCPSCFTPLTETPYHAVEDEFGNYDVVETDLGNYGVCKLP